MINKILYLSQSQIDSNKGYAIQIMKMCEAFKNASVDIELISVRYKKNKDINKEFLFNYFDIKNRFELKFEEIPFIIKLGKLGYFIQGLFFSFKIFFKNKISLGDIIYTRDWIPALFFSLFGKKVFFEIHTHHGSLGARITNHFVSGVVVISRGLKDFYSKKIADKPIYVSPSGVDLFDFSSKGDVVDIRSELNLSKDTKIIMYTGHLYDWKGVDILIKSANKLDNNIKIVCIGGLNNKLQLDSKDIKNIFFVQGKPFNIIASYMRSADAFVVPNTGASIISKNFTSPLKLFTYMSIGKPILVSDLPSMREIVNDNMVYFFKPDDENSFLEVVKKVLSLDESKTNNIEKINRSLEEVKKYSWSNRAVGLLKFIEYTR